MKNEQFLKRWETPLEKCNRMSMGLLKDDGTLTLEIADVSKEEDHKYRIEFDSFEAYKSTNESYLNELWNLRSENIGFTFVVENSKWVKDLMTDPIFQDHCEGIVHYVIATLDEGIEVLAKAKPRISSIKIEKQK